MARTRVTLYGGLNEIGGNKFLLEEGEDRLLLDFGTSIGARNQFFEEFLTPRTNAVLRDLLELDLLPDVDGIYRRDLLEVAATETDMDLPESADEHIQRSGSPLVHAVLLTHAHVDHFQDISFLDPRIPVYCTPTTKALLGAIEGVTNTGVDKEMMTARLRYVDELKSGLNAGEPKVRTQAQPRDVRVCPEGAPFKVGPFEVTAVPVDHSVPGACAFHIRTPAGRTVFYTGDIRFHGALHDRTEKLRAFAEDLRPDLLLTEGTRMGDTQKDDEAGVARDVLALVREAEGLAIAEFGWKDTTRFDTLQQVAAETGRELVISPKLAFVLRQLAHLQDVPSRSVEHYDNVRVYLRRRGSMLGSPADQPKWALGYELDWSQEHIKAGLKAGDEVATRDALMHWRNGLRASDIREHPERYLLHLSYFEINELFDLRPPPGSRWVRCLTEPYSDEMAMDLDRQKRWLAEFDLAHNVRTDTGVDADLNGTLGGTTHVSGHAAGADLVPFLKGMHARHVVPVHVEAKNLHHYDGIGDQRHTFEGMTFQNAARGEAVVEL